MSLATMVLASWVSGSRGKWQVEVMACSCWHSLTFRGSSNGTHFLGGIKQAEEMYDNSNVQ